MDDAHIHILSSIINELINIQLQKELAILKAWPANSAQSPLSPWVSIFSSVVEGILTLLSRTARKWGLNFLDLALGALLTRTDHSNSYGPTTNLPFYLYLYLPCLTTQRDLKNTTNNLIKQPIWMTVRLPMENIHNKRIYKEDSGASKTITWKEYGRARHILYRIELILSLSTLVRQYRQVFNRKREFQFDFSS